MMGEVPWFVLSLGVASIACSLSVTLFYVGVALGLLGTVLGILSWRAIPLGMRRAKTARTATVASSLGFAAGLLVWFVHVRAIQTGYRVPDRTELLDDFGQRLAGATAPLPGAPPRTLPPAPGAEKKAPRP